MPPSNPLEVTLPILTVSENRTLREHRMAVVRRSNAQRTGVCVAIRPLLRVAGYTSAQKASPSEGHGVLGEPIVVTLTRLSKGVLDDDNLRGALKSVRDGVADALGLASDRDPRVRWDYAQGKASRTRPFGVRIEVRPREIEAERPRAGEG